MPRTKKLTSHLAHLKELEAKAVVSLATASMPTQEEMRALHQKAIEELDAAAAAEAASPTAAQALAGKRITEIRQMSVTELSREGWTPDRFYRPLVIVLEDGSLLYASRDGEGNGPGALFGRLADGTSVYVQEER